MNSKIKLMDLLKEAVIQGASDVHLVAGLPPAFRVAGEIILCGGERLDADSTWGLISELLNQEQKEIFERELQLGFSFFQPGLAHFRVSVYSSRGQVEVAIRVRNIGITPIDELGLPEVVQDLTRKPNGLVLITGPTGTGKTTTLYAMLDLINRERRCKVITLEDPIEYVHSHLKSIIIQQELGRDFKSFSQALNHILRLDPDVICVGEMRDLETINAAVTAAETGHLVIATLHTQDTAQTMDRIIDAMPPGRQQQMRAQLANSLQGVISQVLVPTVDRKSRVMACEVLIANDAVRNTIREGKTMALYNIVQSGGALGMLSLDSSLKELYSRGIITLDVAASKARNQRFILEKVAV
jgi:twitching motility protein PilT